MPLPPHSNSAVLPLMALIFHFTCYHQPSTLLVQALVTASTKLEDWLTVKCLYDGWTGIFVIQQ